MSETKVGTGAPGDLSREQARVDHAYACLAAMRARAVHIKSLGYLGGNVTEGGVEAHDLQQWEMDKQRRIDVLSDSSTALCFGRIDAADRRTWYIGRRHVEDQLGEPVVTDWRAPVATPFYRATVADPMGLHLRRRFLIEGRHLVDFFDEHLDDPTAGDAASYVPDPLLAEINRTRTGEMRDIVSTIQAEQDVIIRAPLDQCIVVQGGPGTGKTAVGLHRAAFLLYEHRELLERQRLLIVGPNRIFLRYISQVLPSLGEVASIQLTIEGLAGTAYPVRAEESPEVARLKGDARMAEVIRRAALDQVKSPADDLRLTTRFGTVALRATDLGELVDTARLRVRRVNDTRNVLRQQMVDLAWRTHLEKVSADVTDREGLEADVRAGAELRAGLDKMWPALTAAGVVRRLLGNRPCLVRSTNGILTPEERDRLSRRPTARVSEERWTRADLALLDEAESLLSGVSQSYGHIVVDEAQDLSAMELRMIARRSRTGSMTILGDLAQSTAPGGQQSWPEVVATLAVPDSHRAELTIGYRVPAPILELANRLLPEAAPGLRASSSVRLAGEPPVVEHVPAPELAAAVAARVAELMSSWVSIAVIVPDSLKEVVMAALRDREVAFVDGERRATLGDHVTVLAPVASKGLEFDAVVAVEPSLICRPEHGGPRLLYVVLTRAVQHLSVLLSEPLPTALAG